MMTKRFGEYRQKKDYHLKFNSHWPYLPVYLGKMRYIRQLLDNLNPKQKIVDLGCGEGELVKEYSAKGFNIIGIDLNYQSKYVRLGNILNLKLPTRSYNVVLCLDVLEHLSFADQEVAIKEMIRILKPYGTLILSLPNLAHFASRLSFLFFGRLMRTSKIGRHQGDRPLAEYLNLLKPNFGLVKIKGLFPTFPLISLCTLKFPAKMHLWHKIYNRLLAWPSICYENIIVIKKI